MYGDKHQHTYAHALRHTHTKVTKKAVLEKYIYIYFCRLQQIEVNLIICTLHSLHLYFVIVVSLYSNEQDRNKWRLNQNVLKFQGI